MSSQTLTCQVNALLVEGLSVAFWFQEEDLRVAVLVEYDRDNREEENLKIGQLVTIYVNDDHDTFLQEYLKGNIKKGTRFHLELDPERFQYCLSILKQGKFLLPKRALKVLKEVFP